MFFIEFFIGVLIQIFIDFISFSITTVESIYQPTVFLVFFCSYLFCLFYFIITFLFCFIFFVVRCLFVITFDFMFSNFDIFISMLLCDLIYLDFLSLILCFQGFIFNFTQSVFCFIYIINLIFLILHHIISIFFSYSIISSGITIILIYQLY